MFNLTQDLGSQELVYEQYRSGGTEQQVDQLQVETEGALTDISSATLLKGPRSAGVQNLELPQPLGAAANATFNTLNVTDKPTTRTNLGLGGLATQNAAAASADAAPAQTAAYVQADVQAILDELRDLKTKLRTAGILTP